jgi:DNA-binding beta-propeller fold protein YncE
MYVTGIDSDNVLEYSLSTAWDVSTASYSQAFYVGTQESQPRGIVFKPDGTKMYIAGANGDEVNEYDLSTAWDISTASFNQYYKDYTVPEGVVTDVFFKPDGTAYWITGRSWDRVYQYRIRSS